MKLNVEMVQSDINLFRRSQNIKFFCNDIEYTQVTEIDTERGYLDYYAMRNGQIIIVGDNAVRHRIFGVCRIEG